MHLFPNRKGESIQLRNYPKIENRDYRPVILAIKELKISILLGKLVFKFIDLGILAKKYKEYKIYILVRFYKVSGIIIFMYHLNKL